MTESGAKLLDERVVEDYDGIAPYVEIAEGFRDVEAGKIGKIYEEDGEFAVEQVDQDAYRNDIFFAPEL